MQDAHYWLSHLTLRDFPTSCPYEDPVDLRQGFVEWTHIAETPLGFKAGRQSVSYADRRVWGPGEWGNVGRYLWDIAKVYCDTDWIRLDGIFGKRVLYSPIGFDDDHYPYDVFGLYGTTKKLPMKLDLFYVYKVDDHGTTKGESGEGDLRRHTLGGYADGKIGKAIDYRGTLAFQLGNEGKDNVQACGANARTGYTFDVPWQPRVGIEYSYASGDSNPKDSLNQTFDGVFGAIDSYYGRMNLFSWMNLRDYEVSFSIKPVSKLRVSLDYHYFELARKRDAWYYGTGKPQARDKSGGSGRALGQEIDLIAKYNLNEHVELMAGYSRFFSGPFIDRACHRGDADSDWTFVQILLSF